MVILSVEKLKSKLQLSRMVCSICAPATLSMVVGICVGSELGRPLVTVTVPSAFTGMLVGVVWAVASVLNRHARELIPTAADLRALPRDIADHARLRFHHTARYNVLQKLAYAGVLFILLPLMILTGLTMSPSFNATAPWLLDIFGGRQSARTIHFIVMVLLVGFFVIHMVMILAAGPVNELRSIITGWYRIDPAKEPRHDTRRCRQTAI